MTIKLSDTQAIILSRACRRDDRIALPLPETLKGGAMQKVVASLVNKGLVAEVFVQAGQPSWRDDEVNNKLTLIATDAAFEALGIELPAQAQPLPKPARRTRQNTKQAQLIAMLQKGATVEEIGAATGWQPHTVRGAFAGALKKRLGLTITSEKVEGRARVYRIER